MKTRWVFIDVRGLLFFLSISCASAEVRFSDSYVFKPPNEAVHSAVAVSKISNLNAHSVQLVAASSPDADKVEFHLLEHKKGIVSMSAQAAVQIAGASTLALHAGGLHIMLMGLSDGFSERTAIEITFVFADGSRLKQKFSMVGASGQGADRFEHHQQH